MLTRQQIKLISSLKYKKYRDRHQLFVAEGRKIIEDLCPAFRCRYLVGEEAEIKTLDINAHEYLYVDDADLLRQISSLSTPHRLLAVFEKPTRPDINNMPPTKGLTIVLDGIQDTGNLGTIVRIADWFGIRQIVCSPDTADIYNPKSVQATMGAMANVDVAYTDLPDFVGRMKLFDTHVYGTFLEGDNIYRHTLTPSGLIVMGNEGKGISERLTPYIDTRLSIPNFSPESRSSESLNVAVATAVVCSEFLRGTYADDVLTKQM